MKNGQLVEYIRNEMKAGYGIVKIKQALAAQGWDNQTIEDSAIDAIGSTDSGAPATQAQEGKPADAGAEARPGAGAAKPGEAGKKARKKLTDMSSPKYAGFWIRLVAMFFDSIILLVLITAVSVPIVLLMGANTFDFTNGVSLESVNMMALLASNIASFAITLLYFVLLTGLKGATFGKMMLKLRVVNENGEAIGVGRSFLRYIGYFVSAMVLYIGYLMIAFNKKKRGLHDMIAGTYVVKA